MEVVFLYAGNFISGDIRHTAVTLDRLDEVIEEFRHDLGENFVWEIYNLAQSMDAREIQFNNRLVRAYDEWAA